MLAGSEARRPSLTRRGLPGGSAPCPAKPAAWAALVRSTEDVRCLAGRCVAVSCCGAFWLLPSAASAAATRYFDTQLTGLTPPTAPVHGPFGAPTVWRSVPLTTSGSSMKAPARSLSSAPLVATSPRSRGGLPSSGRRSLNRGNLRRRRRNGANAIGVYSASGAFLRHIAFGYSGCGEIAIAVDNSGGAGGPGEGEQGRLYVTYNCSVRGVQALSPSGSPVDFSASAGYIFGNEITGTPAGEFESPGRVVATDSHGDIYIFGRVGERRMAPSMSLRPAGASSASFTGAEVPGGLSETLKASPSIPPTAISSLLATAAKARSLNSAKRENSSRSSPAPPKAAPSATSPASPSAPPATSTPPTPTRASSTSSFPLVSALFPKRPPKPQPKSNATPPLSMPRPSSVVAARSPTAGSNTRSPPNTSPGPNPNPTPPPHPASTAPAKPSVPPASRSKAPPRCML